MESRLPDISTDISSFAVPSNLRRSAGRLANTGDKYNGGICKEKKMSILLKIHRKHSICHDSYEHTKYHESRRNQGKRRGDAIRTIN